MLLDDIIKNKRSEVALLKEKLPARHLLNNISFLPPRLSFKSAVSRPGRLSLIAEIKRMSPSAGVILNAADITSVVRSYVSAGARALSILTDQKYFGGNTDDIKAVKSRFRIPILRKDFIIDKYQIFESKYVGADAVLLIARILTQKELGILLYIAEEIGLDALVEVHTEEELDMALTLGSELIGINNRDLDTMSVDLNTTEKLIGHIPRSVTIVSESGIKTHEDLEYLKRLGVNAVLIGETLLKSGDISATLREIMGG